MDWFVRLFDYVWFYIKLCWYKIVNNNMAILFNLKREVELLPNKIWTDEDFEKIRTAEEASKEVYNKLYARKRRRLVKSVMHIENKIRAFVRKEFGGESDLIKEFNNYSFFPIGYIVNSFNIEENKCWQRGKCDFLYFIDKLIDEMQVRDDLKSTGFKGFLRLLLYLLILGLVYVLLFENNVYPIYLEPYLDCVLKKVLLFIMCALLFFLIVRFDEIKFLLGLFIPVLLAYLSACFMI